MEYKTPKVLEKKTVIAGLDLKIIVVISACLLLFLFTVFKSFLLASLFIAIAIGYLKIQTKYPGKGQLKMLIKYKIGIQCIRIHQPMKTFIKR
jgi:hypothetical protein